MSSVTLIWSRRRYSDGMGTRVLSRRRLLEGSLSLAGWGLLVGCGLSARRAQQPPTVPLVGWISGASAEANSAITEAFRQGLREQGYVESRSIAVEYRFGDGRDERLPELVAQFVTLNAAVIVTSGTQAALAAKQATRDIPIVAVSADPVGIGLVSSLARPGGNITGFRIQTSGLFGKRVELIQQAAPGTSRLASLGDATNAASKIGLDEVREAAQKLGLQVLALEVRSPADVEQALAGTGGGTDALVVQDDALTLSNQARIVELAARQRVPAMYPRREFVERGGLLAYGVSFPDLWRRVAAPVDKILKGANPADLPVEQPTTFDFVVNLQTARALGLTIPPSVLQQATEVIQ